jgi:maltose O-acetyltransferase
MLNIGRNVTFHNPSLVHLGNYVHISYGCLLMATDHIWIDDEVMFGPYCILVSGNHTRINESYRFGPAVCNPISIGKGSWLGAHVVVTAGSIVGSGSMVAAGAIVAGSFPPNCLLGGTPARMIKAFD